MRGSGDRLPVTQREAGQRIPNASGSPITNKTTAPSQPAISFPTPSGNNNASLKGKHEIKKEEDRLNGVLALKSAARVIYWDLSELEDWPKIEDADAMESHNVRVMVFIRTHTSPDACFRLCFHQMLLATQ
jgi:hypothetical protein